MNQEKQYIRKRIWKAGFQSIAFYICRIFPIKKNKIVFCCIEGTTGYSCNPKYIAEELIRRNKQESDGKKRFKLVWLVNDMSKSFPKEIQVVHNGIGRISYQQPDSGLTIAGNSWKPEKEKGRYIFRHGMRS